MSSAQAPSQTAVTSPISRSTNGRLRLTYPTRGYAVSHNPFAIGAILPTIVACFLALEVAILVNAPMDLAVGAFLVMTCGLLAIPAVALRGSINLTHDGITFERGKDHFTAAWNQVQGVSWSRYCGLCLDVATTSMTSDRMRLPGGFSAESGQARIPLRLFGDRQFSILYDIRDRLPAASWMPALEKGSTRTTTRCLMVYGGVVVIDTLALLATLYIVSH